MPLDLFAGTYPELFVAVDLETTGTDPQQDEILEIAAVRFRPDGTVVERFQTLVKPAGSIGLKIQGLTGIDPEMVRQAPFIHQVRREVAAFLGDLPLVGHSVGFDLEFLRTAGIVPRGPVFDTYALAQLLLPGLRSYSLVSVARALGIPHPEAHRALPDTEVSARVFVALLRRLEALPPDLLQELLDLLEGVRVEGMEPVRLLAPALRKALEAPPAPPRRGGEGVHPPPRPQRPAVTAEAVEAFFRTDGPLAAALGEGYEPRPQQREMALAVLEALRAGGDLLVEAGTGTGKSLAYLVPAALFSLATGRRVLISTYTRNLQDQLLDKDVPVLQAALEAAGEPPVRVALLKGRANYLCLGRLADLRRRAVTLSPLERWGLAKLLIWALTTEDGERSGLPLAREEERIWEQVAALPEVCRGPAHRNCFFFRARRRAEGAHLLIVNHALLLADVATEGGLLPEARHAVLDEAHHLEEAATRALGFSLDLEGLLIHLTGIWQDQGEGRIGGLAGRFYALLHGEAWPDRWKEPALAALEALGEGIGRAVRESRELFAALEAHAAEHGRERGPYDLRLRLTPGQRHQASWDRVERIWGDLAGTWGWVEAQMVRLGQILEELEATGQAEEATPLLGDWRAALQGHRELAQQLAVAVEGTEANAVYWLQVRRRDGRLSLHVAPLQVGELLRDRVFGRLEAAILTSATLSTEGSLEYVRSQLGLEAAEELILGSPFDYKGAVLLYLPVDMPEPNHPAYERALRQTLIDLCRATEGRALILFTSHSALRRTYQALEPELEAAGITVLGQGIDGGRRALLRRFVEEERTVLLGTSSFWEGVDVVGEDLSVLVITRLPFRVPDDPVFEARSEQYENPFLEYALPQSILRFKQGFGRLIRSKTDRGVVAILDSRVLTKSYGRAFLDSLPPCTVRRGRLSALPREARAWLER